MSYGNEGKRIAYSYKSLYKVNTKIYNIGDMRLPFPINVDMAVLYFAYLIVFNILFYLFPVLLMLIPVIDDTLIRIGLPFAVAMLTNNLDPAGKSVMKYLLDILKFAVRSKLTRRGEKVGALASRYKPEWVVGVRKVIMEGRNIIYPQLPVVGSSKNLEGLNLEIEQPAEIEINRSGKVKLKPGKINTAYDQEIPLKRKTKLQCGPGEIRILHRAKGLVVQFKAKGGSSWHQEERA